MSFPKMSNVFCTCYSFKSLRKGNLSVCHILNLFPKGQHCFDLHLRSVVKKPLNQLRFYNVLKFWDALFHLVNVLNKNIQV